MQNYHTHSTYCDGKAKPEEFVKEAIKKGFTNLGFSGHSPLPFETYFAIKENEFINYCNEIRNLKKKYSGEIEISLGLEADFIPELSASFDEFRKNGNLDYIIGAVHLVKQNNELWFIDGPKQETYDDGVKKLFGGNIQKAVKTYFHQINKMIETQNIEVVAHLDKIKMHNNGRYFNITDKWYNSLILETLSLIKEKDIIVEINLRGLYKKRSDSHFPGSEIWSTLIENNTPIMIGMDAHKPEELGLLFNDTIQKLKSTGFRKRTIFSKGRWVEVEL